MQRLEVLWLVLKKILAAKKENKLKLPLSIIEANPSILSQLIIMVVSLAAMAVVALAIYAIIKSH